MATCRLAVIFIFTFVGQTARTSCGEERQDASPRAPVINSLGMKFVWIPAGEARIGSPTSEPGREVNEPLRVIRFGEGFNLGACEVTQAQFYAVMQSNPSAFSRAGYHAKSVVGINTTNFPVESITWAEAVAFCDALSNLPDERRAGRKYRLPTDAEWEYACRAGSSTIWQFGDDLTDLPDYAWFGRAAVGHRPHPVGQKRPNRWGLFDMHGNVWEWCADIDMTDEHARIIRGGSWFSPAANTRSATRRDDPATVKDPDTGFRVLLEF